MVRKMSMERIIEALRTLRVGTTIAEYDLQNKIADALDLAEIPYAREHLLGRGSRVDFLAAGVAVEVKKGKPNRSKLVAQIERYAAYDEVDAVVIVVETSLFAPIRETSNGKPCAVVGLQKLWGIAL
jgi:hypothetical protein